jgi:cytochrome c oxidase cbb3-type subunit III
MQPYMDNCAACHGDDGKGNAELGAPNLTDKIWLYGGTVEAGGGTGRKAPPRRDARLGRTA